MDGFCLIFSAIPAKFRSKPIRFLLLVPQSKTRLVLPSGLIYTQIRWWERKKAT